MSNIQHTKIWKYIMDKIDEIKDVKPCFRGAFVDEESAYWISATEQFINGVPKFDDKSSSVQFVKRYCRIGSNPNFPALHHSITTLIGWSQVENILMNKIRQYDQRWKRTLPEKDILNNNRFLAKQDIDAENNDLLSGSGLDVYNYLISRLTLSIHAKISLASTENTIRYLFYHMRCGIVVMIRNNKVVIFCPFVNNDYKNNWGDILKIDCESDSLRDYYQEKSHHYRQENFLPDKSQWWANGSIICNEHHRPSVPADKNQWWGDNFLLQLKDMLVETCRLRKVPDCDFFLNKRDYPQMKYNSSLHGGRGGLVEPYGFLFDNDDRDPNQDIPLAEEVYASYAPVMSFYSSSRFADIPFPSSEDWEAATGKVFPPSFEHTVLGNEVVPAAEPRDLFTETNFQKFQVPWEDKVPTAFFRGTATGGGVTIETNQRLHLSQLSYEWSLLPQVDITSSSNSNSSREQLSRKRKREDVDQEVRWTR